MKVRDVIVITLIVFLGTIGFFYVTQPVPLDTTVSTGDATNTPTMSTSTLTGYLSRGFLINKAYILSLHIKYITSNSWQDIIQFIEKYSSRNSLQPLQDLASSTVSNLLCTPESANFSCVTITNDLTSTTETGKVCGCMPSACSSGQKVSYKITENVWPDGTLKGQFFCADTN